MSLIEQANKPKSSNDDTSRKAFSPKLEEFTRALAVLYITKNISGRNKFLEKWPDVAAFIFGPELIEFDTQGVHPKDYALRSALEEKAEETRFALKATLAEVEEKSVKSGSLVFEYVAGVIDQYGPLISRLIFAENIIERVKPGLLAKADEDKKKKEQEALLAHQQEEDAIRKRAQSLGATVRNRPPPQEVKAVSSIEIPDEVRPIEAGTPLPAEVSPAPAVSQVHVTPEAPPPPPAVKAVPVSSDHAATVSPVLNKPEKGLCKGAFNRAAVLSAA